MYEPPKRRKLTKTGRKKGYAADTAPIAAYPLNSKICRSITLSRWSFMIFIVKWDMTLTRWAIISQPVEAATIIKAHLRLKNFEALLKDISTSLLIIAQLIEMQSVLVW